MMPAVRSPAAAAQVPTDAPETRWFGPARYQNIAGLHVLNLAGSHYEMGRQHGALMKDAVRTGPIPYYRTYIRKLLRTSGAGPLSPLIARGIERFVGRRVAQALPDYARESIRGLADGAELDYDYLLEGCVMPDSLLWVAAKSMKVRNISPAVHHRMQMGLGCSSAIAWGDATRDGALLHARNLDYHGVDVWPRSQAVVFHSPDSGQRYVSLAAAGIPMGGFTAMNEAGLTLTVHQHMFTDATELGGTPIGAVGDLVMREALDLDQAQAILERHTPIGCWTYLIGDGNTKQVLCYEENPRHHSARRTTGEQSTFGYANIYLDDELGATERELYGSYWRHNLGRQQRLDERLTAAAGKLDADTMASIVGDHGGTDCRIHKAIAMLMTVASVVFRPEDGTLWVATGEAPVSNNAYQPFDLARGEHAPERGNLTGGMPTDEAARDAFDAYRRAYISYFDRDDVTGARALLERARQLQPRQPLYAALAGLVALHDADANAAWSALDRAIALGHPDPERVAAFHLWRGRAADLLSRRSDAVADYRRALGSPADAPVHRAARKGIARHFTPTRAAKIDIDFTYADVISP